MATATPMNDADIPLIEEHVETGLQQLLDVYRTSYVPGGEKKDDLMSRFTLYPGGRCRILTMPTPRPTKRGMILTPCAASTRWCAIMNSPSANRL